MIRKKINYKFGLLYIFLLFLAVFFYKNYAYFSGYVKNFRFYLTLDKIKVNQELTYTSLTGFESLSLPDFDKANLFLLNKNFSKAKKEIYKKEVFTYKDFYNLGNIYFLSFLNSLGKLTGDYVKLVQQANSNYSLSMEMIPSYVVKYPLIYNFNLAKSSVLASYVIFCDNLFLNLIYKTKKLLSVLDNIIDILKKQDLALKKWYTYKDLNKCIDSLRADASKNISLVYENKVFFKKVKQGLIYKMIDYVDNEDLCYQQKELINQKYGDSLESSLKYFNKFQKLQKDLLLVYEKADYFQMKYLCENKSKLSKNLSSQNSKMQKNYNNLSDLANKPKPRRKNKSNPQSQGEKEKQQANNDKTKKQDGNKNQDDKKGLPKEEFEKFKQDKVKRLLEINRHYINQMIQGWSDLNKSVYQEYIRKLFKNLEDITKDYKEPKKETIGK